MRTVSCFDLIEGLDSVLNDLTERGEPLFVTREDGTPVAVLMSFTEFASWKETLHLLRSPANAARLRGAVMEFRA